MLMLCTSSWNVSGRQCLLLPSTGATWRLVPFCGCCIYLVLFLCPAQSRPTELYISTNRDGLGPLYQPHLFLQERLRLHEVQSLKTKEKLKKIQQENRKWLPFGTPVSCSTQAKITIACFCNCLDPSSDRPNSRGPPSILSTWTTLTWRGFQCCTSIERLSSLPLHLSTVSMYIRHNDT